MRQAKVVVVWSRLQNANIEESETHEIGVEIVDRIFSPEVEGVHVP